MKKILLSCLLCIVSFSLPAQKIHDPAEIIKIMDASQIRYSLEALTTTEIPDFSERVIYHEFYGKKSPDGSFVVKQYELNDSAAHHYQIAEKFFEQKNHEQARYHYRKALEADPTCYKVMVYIGDTYYHQQRYVEALTWYQRATDSNYIDYLAHWACANALVYMGKQEQALREITIAKVLNRNNPRLTSKLQEIYHLNKKSYNDWYFVPLYDLSEDNDAEGKRTVKIRFKEYWLPYAMAKAVWKYEPGYAESMGNNIILGEKEAVLSYWIMVSSHKEGKKTMPAKALKLAMESNCFESYVIYEALLPAMPEIAMYIGKEGIEAIASYILDVRSKIKK